MLPTLPTASLLLACALSALPAAQLSYHVMPPTLGTNDVSNLVGASRDRDNIGGDGYADGDGNDSATYIAGVDRPHQGQTFTTGGNPAGYQVNAVWLRHVAYTSNTGATWWCAPSNGAFTVRVTRPSAVGTFAFALTKEAFTTTGTESGTPNSLTPVATRVNSPEGTGVWLRFAFTSPITLFPNTLYGFDVAAHSRDFFFETLGLRTTADRDAYPAGAAYSGSTIGAADNTLEPLEGDRVFVVELSPGIDVARNGDDVFLAWAQLPSPIRHIEIHRNTLPTPGGRIRIATITPPVNTFVEKVPDATASYWYWLVVTRPDGITETIGPVATRSAEVWVP